MKGIFGTVLVLIVFFAISNSLGQTINFVSSRAFYGTVYDVFVLGNYAYLATDLNSLKIINIADPTNPFIVGILGNCGSSNLFVLGTHAFMTNNSNIYIIDITDVQQPHISGTYTCPIKPRSIFVENNYLYYTYWDFGNDDKGFQILDIQNPDNPVNMGNCYLHDSATKMIIIGNYAYTTGQSDLQAINITDPTNPFTVGRCGWGVTNCLCYDGTLIWSAGSVTLSGPPFPTWQTMINGGTDPSCPGAGGGGTYLTQNWPSQIDIGIWANYVILYGISGGIRLCDVSNFSPPFSPPVVVSQYTTPGTGYGMFIKNDYIYLADGSAFIILRVLSSDIEDVAEIPSAFSLSPNYPNPFNSSTTIRYNLPTESPVTIDIYDILGRKVQTLLDVKAQAGPNQVNWNADGLPSGAYFARLKAGEQTQTMKMMLIK